MKQAGKDHGGLEIKPQGAAASMIQTDCCLHRRAVLMTRPQISQDICVFNSILENTMPRKQNVSVSCMWPIGCGCLSHCAWLRLCLKPKQWAGSHVHLYGGSALDGSLGDRVNLGVGWCLCCPNKGLRTESIKYASKCVLATCLSVDLGKSAGFKSKILFANVLIP